jgi:uncharacterized protein
MTRDFDPAGRRLPIKLDSTSNGEFPPIPLSRTNRWANRLARERPRGIPNAVAGADTRS